MRCLVCDFLGGELRGDGFRSRLCNGVCGAETSGRGQALLAFDKRLPGFLSPQVGIIMLRAAEVDDERVESWRRGAHTAGFAARSRNQVPPPAGCTRSDMLVSGPDSAREGPGRRVRSGSRATRRVCSVWGCRYRAPRAACACVREARVVLTAGMVRPGAVPVWGRRR
eukprot:1199836-Rhodomonas_salina.1